MATVYGESKWGMLDEDGMYAQDFSFDRTVDEDWLPNATGDDVAGALFNDKGTFSLDGFEKTSGFSAALGASITLNNLVDGDDIAGASTIVTGTKFGVKSRGHKTVNVSGVWKPYIGALQT